MSAKGDSPASLAVGLCGLLRRHDDFGPLCMDALHALALSIQLGGGGAATAALSAALSAGAVELSLEWVGRRGGGALAEREMQAAGAAVLAATFGARTAVGGSAEEEGAEEGGGRLAQAPATALARAPATALCSASPAADASAPDETRRRAALLRSAAQRLVSAGGVGIIASALHAHANPSAATDHLVLALLGAYRAIAPTFADCWAQLEDARVLRACTGIVLAASSGTPEGGGGSAACADGADGAHRGRGAQGMAVTSAGNGRGALSVLRSRASRHAAKASLHLLCAALLMRTHGGTPGGAVSGVSGTPTHSCARGAGEGAVSGGLGAPLAQSSAASMALSSAVLQLLAALARLAVETRHDAPKLLGELERAAHAAAAVPHVLRGDREGAGS